MQSYGSSTAIYSKQCCICLTGKASQDPPAHHLTFCIPSYNKPNSKHALPGLPLKNTTYVAISHSLARYSTGQAEGKIGRPHGMLSGSPASSSFSLESDLLVRSIRPRRTPPPQPRSLLLILDPGRRDPQTVPKRRVPKLDEEVGAIAEGHHGRDDAGGARGHVCDGQAGEDAGAFGEPVGFARDVAASGRGVGDLLPAGDFGVNAVGPETILECLGQDITLRGKTFEGGKAYIVNVYDALLPTRCHIEDVGQTETFTFERALAIALHDDVGFFEELVEHCTIFLEVKVETAFTFANGKSYLKVLQRRKSSAWPR